MSVWNFEGLVYGDPTVCDRSVSLRLLVLARVHSEPVKCPQQSVTYDHQAGKVSVVEVGRVFRAGQSCVDVWQSSQSEVVSACVSSLRACKMSTAVSDDFRGLRW